MTDIIIQGIGGRMGHVLCEMIAKREDCRVVAGVDREAGKVGDIPVYAGFEGLPKVDAIIDFSSPAGAVAAAQYGAKNGLPCVICSTGLSREDEAALEAASTRTPIFRSACWHRRRCTGGCRAGSFLPRAPCCTRAPDGPLSHRHPDGPKA